ncbi:MAG: hypothetical protein K1Y36_10410 [Blastocatellia bacterium]|nr:hypothetical protein [Blastocatellia bacterium]
MAAKKFTDKERAEVMPRVAKDWARGMTARELGEKYGVSERSIKNYIAAFRAEWKREIKLATETVMARKLAESQDIKAEAWAEWERSKQNAEKEVTKTEGTGESETAQALVERTKTVAGQCGDPRYLSVIGNQLDYESNLLGLYPPKKIAPTTPEGDLLPVKVVVGIDHDKI